jgi:hypothetical protein
VVLVKRVQGVAIGSWIGVFTVLRPDFSISTTFRGLDLSLLVAKKSEEFIFIEYYI